MINFPKGDQPWSYYSMGLEVLYRQVGEACNYVASWFGLTQCSEARLTCRQGRGEPAVN